MQHLHKLSIPAIPTIPINPINPTNPSKLTTPTTVVILLPLLPLLRYLEKITTVLLRRVADSNKFLVLEACESLQSLCDTGVRMLLSIFNTCPP